MKTKTIVKIVLLILIAVVAYIFLGIIGVALRGISEGMGETEEMQIGDDYYFTYDPSWGYSEIVDLNIVVIDMEIVAWNFDSTFIIAKQKPFRNISDSIYNINANTNYNELTKLYNESKIYNYWIIDKREELLWDTINRRHTGSVKGPFTYEKYLEKRRELGVPDSLKLRETEKGSFDGLFDALFYEWFYSPTARERIVE